MTTAPPTRTIYSGLLLLARDPDTLDDVDSLRDGPSPLPEDYVRFCEASLGWDLPYSVFVGGRPYVFDHVPADAYVSGSWFEDQLPADFYAFGRTGGECDTILIDLSDEGYGRVLAWISGRPFPGREPESRLHLVAESFDAFLAGLVLLQSSLDEEPDLDEDEEVRAWLETCAVADSHVTLDAFSGREIPWGKAYRSRGQPPAER